MKYNQIFYNYTGIFRYLKMARSFEASVKSVSPSLDRFVETMVVRRLDNAKWRKKGLMRDDLIMEENDVVVEALKRLPQEQYYGRYRRFKLALHYDLTRRDMPQEMQMTQEKDKAYLLPFVEQVIAEHEEAEKYDTGVFQRQQ